MKNVFFILTAFSLGGCLDTQVRDYGDPVEVTDLDSARSAWVKRSAKSAIPFYTDYLAKNPQSPEALFFVAGAKDAFEFPKMPDVEAPASGSLLRYLAAGQKTLRGPSEFFEDVLKDYLRVPTPEDLQFAPYELGMDGVRVVFDRATYLNVLAQAEGYNFILGLGRALDLRRAAALDTKLTGFVKAEFKKPECQKEENALACANRVMVQALAVMNDTADKKFGAMFTVSEGEGVDLALDLGRAVSAVDALIFAMKKREKLPEGSEYLQRSFSSNDKAFMPCAAGSCLIPLSENDSIRLDVRGFLNNLLAGDGRVKGLRSFFPSKMVVVDPNSGSFDEFLKGLEFADPTLGGLFPDGDLKAKVANHQDSDIAQVLQIYSRFIYEWTFGSDRR